jgi:hypothetical protein
MSVQDKVVYIVNKCLEDINNEIVQLKSTVKDEDNIKQIDKIIAMMGNLKVTKKAVSTAVKAEEQCEHIPKCGKNKGIRCTKKGILRENGKILCSSHCSTTKRLKVKTEEPKKKPKKTETDEEEVDEIDD